jgi:gamma-glutamyltranspeptidase/glutathione hydrolase
MIRSRHSVTQRTALAAEGMIVAGHPLGAEVGASILARGGNAIDAAVATAFAMTVVEPFMSSLAGAGSMLVYLAGSGETIALDFNVEAPTACYDSCYTLTDGVAQDLFPWRRVVDDANIFGARAVAVPGSVAGLCLALERFGSMDLTDILAPAIRLAEDGFIPDWYVALTMAQYCQELQAFPETARNYLRNSHYIYRSPSLIDGDVLRQPDLARSLRLIAKEGPSAFYRGEISQAIDEEMRSNQGFLTRDDLTAYAPRVLAPLRGSYRDLELALMPGATGGITALEVLNLLSNFPQTRVGYATASGLHLRAEAVRYAFLDRLRYLGDPLQVKVPWQALASRDYAAELAKGFTPLGSRSGGSAPDVWAYEARPGTLLGRQDKGVSPEGAPPPEKSVKSEGWGDCTTHVGAVDRQRNMVSLTHTITSLFGARMVVPGTGILLSNGMIWFDPEPGRANSITARKRPLVNMVPVLAFRHGEPYLTLGAAGGRKIVSAIPQVISNMVDVGDSCQAAIEAPRLHTEGTDLWVDDQVSEKHLNTLRKKKHPVVGKHPSFGTFYFARPVAIRVTRKGLEVGLDPFSAAAAAGH